MIVSRMNLSLIKKDYEEGKHKHCFEPTGPSRLDQQAAFVFLFQVKTCSAVG